ncbi:D-alanyl-D-alanine carboxypeptidase family protein [Metallibacterium scheffleri]|uniref:serine-type D-Ala-D-Ala carboxypeptidase n=1 Tax=Metallibacterium scheffleri TaxID=993689 RepID=A0A4S3KS06_9GAMM|nr:D-alanyl-D-alanine carboxypeptidase family protein [Metallibacterium scheffleri]THD11756.1 peptidase M15 [Metallibacterium scheffleri]
MKCIRSPAARHPRWRIAALVLVAALGSAIAAARPDLPPLPTIPALPLPPRMLAPQIGARAAVLLDVNSGQTLLAQNADAAVNPSGLVKLMTAFVLGQAEQQGLLHAGSTVRVPVSAWRVAGSRMFIQPGLPVTVAQLEDGLLIDGGNDAAIAIAKDVAGTTGGFVDLMNHDAAALDLRRTHFVNPDGLPQAGQVSTAMDLARLSSALVRDYPAVLGVAGRATYTYDHIRQFNYNPLAGQRDVDGLGVGLTNHNLWDLDICAHRSGRTLIAVVIGAPSRAAAGSDASALLTYGWNGWRQENIGKPGQAVALLKNLDWSPDVLSVVTPYTVNVVVPAQRGAHALTRFVALPGIQAPIKAGQTVGSLDILWHKQVLRSVPVVAASAVQPADWFVRMLHRAEADI